MLNLAPPIPPKVSFQGFGLYEGPAPKAAGGQYNCTATACYAIGKDRQEVFKSLQKNVNRFATMVGFKKLVVDGFIGHDTAAATAATLQYLRGSAGAAVSPEAAAILATPAPEMVARYALELRNQINASAEVLKQPFVPGRTPTPVEKAEKEQIEVEIKQRGDETADYQWAWWAIGGVVLAGAVAVGVSLMRKDRKRRPTRKRRRRRRR